jgi:hypothetical protein
VRHALLEGILGAAVLEALSPRTSHEAKEQGDSQNREDGTKAHEAGDCRQIKCDHGDAAPAGGAMGATWRSAEPKRDGVGSVPLAL